VQAVVEVDVLVIGSGAGGGVAAGVLAEAGLKVLLVEKGSYTHPADVPRADDAAAANAYEAAMLTSTRDTGAPAPDPPVSPTHAHRRSVIALLCGSLLFCALT
jgi:choline dehydrogenase-like flavoprotein